MNKNILFALLVVFILTAAPLLTVARECFSEDTVFEASSADVVAPDRFVSFSHTDEKLMTLERDAQEKIQDVIKKIELLEDRNEEAELQKRIERIKYNAEVARFTIEMKMAEESGDFDIALEIKRQLAHLANLEKPVIGIPEERPSPEFETVK